MIGSNLNEFIHLNRHFFYFASFNCLKRPDLQFFTAYRMVIVFELWFLSLHFIWYRPCCLYSIWLKFMTKLKVFSKAKQWCNPHVQNYFSSKMTYFWKWEYFFGNFGAVFICDAVTIFSISRHILYQFIRNSWAK